jgi:DNA-directed RNA polymerase subunit RPC12/RpoP
MKSLDEFNAERGRHWKFLNDPSPVPNGIACPECGKEMLDSNPMVTLTSNPPQKNIHCPECSYRGYRIA